MRFAKTVLPTLILLGASVVALAALRGGSGAAEPPGPDPAQSAPSATAARRTKPVTISVGSAPAQKLVGIDPHEVTVAEFKACVDAGACRPDDFTVQADSPCNYGAAGRADHPMNCVSFLGAEAYCRYAGERLCTEEEWFAGCRGPSRLDYPYGAHYVAGACRGKARTGLVIAEQSTAPVGSTAGCEGGYPGLWDMVGNVAEWLDSCNGDYCHFYGGAFLENEPAEDFASCKRMCAGNQKSFRSSTIGFRCCSDGAPK